jgi:hypothetical protein
MLGNTRNKVDLFEAMNNGSIILINTAKDLLKQEGCEILGRFFIALISQAVQERASIPEDRRPPTFVYIDEAQDYFDESIEHLLNQARKYKVGLVIAHQNLDQFSQKLFSPGLEHRPPHDGVGCFGLPMLHAESAEIGALQQCRRDGRRIVPAEIPSAAGGSRCSARHPLTFCVDHRKLVPSRHRRCRMTASLRASATFALVAPLRLAKRMPHAFNIDTRVSSTLAASNR